MLVRGIMKIKSCMPPNGFLILALLLVLRLLPWMLMQLRDSDIAHQDPPDPPIVELAPHRGEGRQHVCSARQTCKAAKRHGHGLNWFTTPIWHAKTIPPTTDFLPVHSRKFPYCLPWPVLGPLYRGLAQHVAGKNNYILQCVRSMKYNYCHVSSSARR